MPIYDSNCLVLLFLSLSLISRGISQRLPYSSTSILKHRGLPSIQKKNLIVKYEPKSVIHDETA
jgi:hypothetical protein